MSVAIKTISSLPYPEHKALEEAPVRWDIGEGKYHIRMATPLFSFAGLEIYKRACWALKITGISPEPIELSVLLEYGSQSKDKEQEVVNTIQEVINNFQKKHDVGVIPRNICDILLNVSHPLSWIEVHQVMTRYANDNNLAWDIPSSPLSEQTKMRQLLATFCAFELDIGDCCLTLVYLERINTTVKKNLLVDEEDQDEKSPFSKASAHSQKKRIEQAQATPST